LEDWLGGRDSNPDRQIQSSFEHSPNQRVQRLGAAKHGKVRQNPQYSRNEDWLDFDWCENEDVGTLASCEREQSWAAVLCNLERHRFRRRYSTMTVQPVVLHLPSRQCQLRYAGRSLRFLGECMYEYQRLCNKCPRACENSVSNRYKIPIGAG
jgi:hypothetical protein